MLIRLVFCPSQGARKGLRDRKQERGVLRTGEDSSEQEVF